MANAPVIVIEDNPSNFLEYRLRGQPSVISFEELNLGHSSLRKIAPYALKIRQTALIPTQQFFSYAAVVATIDETSLACIIFDLVNADEIIAYAGHFVIQKNFLFDPVSREPVISDLSLLDSKIYQSHLTLFSSANPHLLQFQDYFLHMCEPYQELVTKSQDMLMSTLQQQNNVVSMPNESNRVVYLLREPLTTSFYHETALPISKKSVKRITQKIQPIGSVKVVYGELGSFHSHSYCQPKATEDATNFNAVDETDGKTTYYSAYEEPGLMPFYYTSYLLGSLRDRHVVGVLEKDNFFIMATKRVYKRNSPAVPISPESLEGSEVVQKIHLPSTLSLSQVVTMLELRQILRHPFMFPEEIEAITKSFGFDEGYFPTHTFSHQIGPKTWLIDMLDVHYTDLFQNSVCEYGETPIDSNKPSLFCLDIARLWIHELLMFIHEDIPPNDDRELSNSFRMTIAKFVQSYLTSFGLSPEFAITCHHLGPDGIPSSVCQMSVSAKDIGKHIQMYHTTPLLVCDHFRPFSLSFTSKFVSLTNQTDVSPLEIIKSPQFFATFWSLTDYDLSVPLAAYVRKGQRLKVAIQQTNENRDLPASKRKKELDRCKASMDNLLEEEKEQKDHNVRIMARLTQEKDSWFLVSESGDRKGVAQFLHHCLFPRCVFSTPDALFCARFVQLMHKLKTPNFSTLYCYDRIFCVITSLTMCTENEANRYGRFLCAMLETVMHWHSNKKIFDEECANYPGFVIKSRVGNQPLENHVDFEIYRHVVYKWHHEISKALVVYLESKDYVQIRNALIVGNGTLVGGVGPFNFQD